MRQKENEKLVLESQLSQAKENINFNPVGPLNSDQVQKMQEELHKLRGESKQLK